MCKFNMNYVLGALAAALAVTCVLSIHAPMRFDGLRAEREQAVKERLVRIRYAEERYRQTNGTYTDDFNELVRGGYLADSLQYVPFSGGKKFDIAVNMQTGKSGRQIPLMECGAEYVEYLDGLDGNSISNLVEEAESAGRYPGLKIGDLTTPNDNAGNWE
jgi:hypothetical protein